MGAALIAAALASAALSLASDVIGDLARMGHGPLASMFFPTATSSAPQTLIFLPEAVWPLWLATHLWRERGRDGSG